MNYSKVVELLVKNPEQIAKEKLPLGFGAIGLLGYVFGFLGLFTYLRMYVYMLPGLFSICAFLVLVILFEFICASILHLILSLCDVKGNSTTVFFAFGCSCWVLTLMVPVAFITKASPDLGYLVFLLVTLSTLWLRIRILRLIYPISVNKAVFVLWIPCCALMGMVLGAAVYVTLWGFWLLFN